MNTKTHGLLIITILLILPALACGISGPWKSEDGRFKLRMIHEYGDVDVIDNWTNTDERFYKFNHYREKGMVFYNWKDRLSGGKVCMYQLKFKEGEDVGELRTLWEFTASGEKCPQYNFKVVRD